MLILSLTAGAEPTMAQPDAGWAVACKAHGTATRLEVNCPTANVGDLLAILQKATGLRSEYPQEFASVRVSVSLARASLLEVLESALSAFNIAVWIDQESPSVTWLRIVDLRGVSERPEQQQRAYEQTAKSSPRAEPTSSASLVPQNNEADMAWEREKFARSITTTHPLEPVAVEAESGLQPVTTVPESGAGKPP